MIDQTLDDIKKLNRHVSRINIEDLEEEYSESTIEIIEDNIDTFKEASYFIEKALVSMKLFNKIHPVLEPYLKRVDWKKIADSMDEAITKFGRFLTNERNYVQYKTIIWNIVKGTMQKRSFDNFFNTIAGRISRPVNTNKEKQRDALPPEMWDEKEQEKWQKMKDKRKKEAIDSEKTDKFREVNFENFIPLKDYKKLYE